MMALYEPSMILEWALSFVQRPTRSQATRPKLKLALGRVRREVSSFGSGREEGNQIAPTNARSKCDDT